MDGGSGRSASTWVKRGDRIGSLPESACGLLMQYVGRKHVESTMLAGYLWRNTMAFRRHTAAVAALGYIATFLAQAPIAPIAGFQNRVNAKNSQVFSCKKHVQRKPV